jgi:hypothetical protein
MSAYFDDKDLAHFGDLKTHHPELWDKFAAYYGAAFEPGILHQPSLMNAGEGCPP